MPLWGLFLVFKLLATLTTGTIPAKFAGTVANSMATLGIAQFFYGGICALLLFGNLFNPRNAYTLHALPLRREGWFLTHLCSGILFYLIPSVAEALLCILLLQEFWYLALLRLAVAFVMFLFFFGIGAFSCQCGGTRLGAMAVYMLVNFLSMVIFYLADTFYSPLLPGVLLDKQLALQLFPGYAFCSGKFIRVESNLGETLPGRWYAEFQGFVGGDWLQLLFAGLIALAFLSVALLLYRRRRIESAGDFISTRFMAPIFLVLYTFLIGTAVYLVGDRSYVFLLVGVVIGFFTGLMLLHKKVHVFQKKAWLSLGVLGVLFLGSLGITAWDPFGVVAFVPAPAQVEQARIGQGYNVTSIGNDIYTLEWVTLDTPEELALLEQLHKSLLPKETKSHTVTTGKLTISYRLKNGLRVERRYDIPRYSQAPELLRLLLSRYDMFEDPAFLKNVVSLYCEDEFDNTKLPRVQILNTALTTERYQTKLDVKHEVNGSLEQDSIALGLWEAIWQDCLAGNTAHDWDYLSRQIGTLEIQYLNENGEKARGNFTIYSGCTNTIAYLKSLTTEQPKDPSLNQSQQYYTLEDFHFLVIGESTLADVLEFFPATPTDTVPATSYGTYCDYPTQDGGCIRIKFQGEDSVVFAIEEIAPSEETSVEP